MTTPAEQPAPDHDVIDVTDSALLKSVLNHPARIAVVCVVERHAGRQVDLRVERTSGGGDQRSLLQPGDLVGEVLPWARGPLTELLLRGGYSEVSNDVDGVRYEAYAADDRLVLLTEPTPGLRAESILESSSDVIQMLDAEGVTRYATAASATVFGHGTEELVGRRFRDFVDEGDAERFDAMLAALLAEPAGTVAEIEVRMRREDAEQHWAHCRATNQMDTPGVAGVVAIWHDVTIPRADRSKLQFAASHDLLTQLPNRTAFNDRLSLALSATARRPGAQVAVLYCDLDHFKGVNDGLGHAAGDELLRQVSRRLREAVRPSDTVARLGGDEFGVVCDGISGDEEAHLIARRALTAVRDSYRLAGAPEEVVVGMSIGVAVSGGGDVANDVLLRRADMALYAAKRQGRGRVVSYNDGTDRWNGLEAELRTAVRDLTLTVHYQPEIVAGTGEVAGYEALVRWEHPELGLLEPTDFLPMADDVGLLPGVDTYVLATAIAQVAAWATSGTGAPSVSVNVSAQTLVRPNIVDEVADVLARHGVPATALTIEVSEMTVGRRSDEALAALRHLRALGVRVAVDDFGSGSSSIADLRDLPLDVVKLDASLDPAMTNGVVVLCHALDVVVVAKGVETASELQRVTELGCDLVQGHHLAFAAAPVA